MLIDLDAVPAEKTVREIAALKGVIRVRLLA